MSLNINSVAVLGNLFGDEGKGAIIHRFSSKSDWVIRVSGSSNCGHTIYLDGKKYVHHLIPSIDFSHPTTKGFLGSGMVINLTELYEELLNLEKDFPGVSKRIYVDPDAFLILPSHIEKDKVGGEIALKIATTNKGVGPAYTDKVSRNGLKIKSLIKNSDPIISKLCRLGVQFKHALELQEEMSNSIILFEGSQGVMLDINHGTYPFVSCGDATIAGIINSGFAFAMPKIVYGVSKCYATKVGNGPFPTEIFGKEAEHLRELGKEYGSTTGRPRRIGWLDLPALKYACIKGGITELILTKFDILDNMERVPVCIAYDKAPVCADDFFTAKPQFITMSGWNKASPHDKNLIEFLKLIEAHVGRKVRYISSGTGPDDMHLIT